MSAMQKESNSTRLETAFYVAEVELGVTRLLDPEDVNVESPDEKSIMTYVAQFLHRYPEGMEGKVSACRFWRRTNNVVLGQGPFACTYGRRFLLHW
jgi:hypothetical protein